ncbi:MAG: c-type cytochrome [Gammaproteobacteria bacterium]
MRRKLPGIGGKLSIKATWPCAFAILCGPLSGSVLAQGNVEVGRLKADTCLGCHGIPGYTNVYPSYHVPILGGQHADYIVSALQAYKAGQRDHDTMHAQAAELSDKDMADIAAYFESLGSAAPGAGKQAQQTASSGSQQTSAKSSGGAQAGGEQTYAQVCSTCHDSGASGAPKLGSKTAWQPRIAQGRQTLYEHAINGIGAMPAKGGDPSLSEADVQAAVDYMVSEAGGAQQTASSGGKAAQESQPAATGAGIKQAAARGASLANESVYQGMCASCHDSGALGAPKITDKSAWQTRIIAMGAEALYTSAIGGVGAMPAKGGNPQASEADVKLAVDYIISQVAGGQRQSGKATAANEPQSGTARKGQ